MSCYYGNRKITEIDINVRPRYWKGVYEEFTLPKMTSNTTPFGTVSDNWNKVYSSSTNVYSIFWNTQGSIQLSCNGNGGNRFIHYAFPHHLEPNVTYRLESWMGRQQNVSISNSGWYYRTDNGDTVIMDTNNLVVNTVSEHSATFTPSSPIESIFWAGSCNTPSTYIFLYFGYLNLTRTDGKPLRYYLGDVETDSSNYDYMTFYKTPISKIYKGSTLVYGIPPGTTLFSSSTPQTTTYQVPSSGMYQIIAVGGGGGSGQDRAGAGAYFNGNVYLNKGALNITIGAGGTASGGYCRNNNGASGGSTTVSQNGVSIVCPGGRYSCGRRNGCGAGQTYAPSYSISTQHTVLYTSYEQTSGTSWYGGYGAGASSCDCDDCAGKAGGSGYVAIIGL